MIVLYPTSDLIPTVDSFQKPSISSFSFNAPKGFYEAGSQAQVAPPQAHLIE